MITEEEIIRKFRITSKYKGYPLIIDALQIATQQFGNCLKITKDIYPILAVKYRDSAYCIERNIRTIVERCWYNNKCLMKEIAGCELKVCPTNTEFIEMIAYYITHDKGVLTNKESN